jgi:hypothetical protein
MTDDDELGAARGILLGLEFALIFWTILAVGVLLVII